jgi:uncharacterized coiled-coil protein SlyX
MPSLAIGPACNTMASTAAHDEAIAQLQEELDFQGVLLSSIDETVLNRRETEQEVKEEIKALKKKLRALQGTGASSASQSQSQSSQPGPSNASVPGSWPTDDIVESSTSRNNASGAASSKMNQLPGQLGCLAFPVCMEPHFLCCNSLNLFSIFRSANPN